jgi:hypothetical protein
MQAVIEIVKNVLTNLSKKMASSSSAGWIAAVTRLNPGDTLRPFVPCNWPGSLIEHLGNLVDANAFFLAPQQIVDDCRHDRAQYRID